MLNWFKRSPAAPRIADEKEVNRRYKRYRWEQAVSMTLGYAIFYVCRLSFSTTKKSMIDGGWYTAKELGVVGSAMLVAYAFGKFAHGFLADRANIRRYMGFGLFVSALMNFTVGWYVPAFVLIGLWFVNGFMQACGATCSIVGISRWYRKRERGTFYGIFSMSNNFGEALSYLLTSFVMVWAGKWFDADPQMVDGHLGTGAAWRSGFWGAAFLGVVGVMLLSKFFHDSPESEGLPSVPEWAHEPPDAVEKAAAGDVKKGQMLALKNWAIWMIAIGGGLYAMTRWAIIDWGMFFLQVKKGYTSTTAAMIITINSIVGGFSSAACGYITDRFFHGKRDGFVFIAGLMNITSLSILMFGPAGCVWLDVFAMVLFGLACGILLTFLGGLMAVDLAPRIATGAALGIAGMGSYIGSGIQSVFSGCLIKKLPEAVETVRLGLDAKGVDQGVIRVFTDGSKLMPSGAWIGANGESINRFYDFTVNLFGHTYTVDWIAMFWIGAAVLSMLCALSVWNARPKQEEEEPKA